MLEVFGLNATTEIVYRTILSHPSWNITRIANELDINTGEIRSALDELFELSLLRASVEHENGLRPVNPEVGLQVLLERQQRELDIQQRKIIESRSVITAVVAEYARPQTERTSVGAERLVGMDAVHGRLEELVGRTKREVLSLMPGGAQSEHALEAGERNNARLLARNVVIRTAMQNSVRNDNATLRYAQTLTDAGGEVRTAPVLPTRMLLVDRTIAIVPIDPDNTRLGVLQLSEPGLLDALLALFEQVWSSAVPLGAHRPRERGDVAEQERELLKLLGSGHTDESAAKRLGVSARTCRRMMAEIMERLGARSRFEAGLLAAREGWL